MDAISFCEAAHTFRTMLEYSPNEVVGDTNVKSAANLACQNVHPENFLFAHGSFREYWIARLRGR
jgi:hypothetical protein